MRIVVDDLTRPEVHSLLNEHLANMRQLTPAGSVHALDIDRLRGPGMTFWTAWADAELLGCGALKELCADHGELKSMRTAGAHRRQGVARAILSHATEVARARGYRMLSLETGSGDAFEPAHALYASEGFIQCGPFAGYAVDPNSVFMTKVLAP